MIYNTIYDVKFNFQFLKRKQCDTVYLDMSYQT